MPIITAENKEVASLLGVHLYHSPFSNCSQRTRLVLAEKGIAWESHEINLMAFEHLTPFYQGIHPKGVVPALVHDGVVIVESHDIIRYLDDHFPGPKLMPASHDEAARIRPWMELGDALQMSIKSLTYDRLFRDKFPPTQEKYAFYAAHQRNPDLVAFYRRFLDGFDPDDIRRYDEAVADFLAQTNRQLGKTPWLAGDAITLADFSAVVNVHRATKLGHDLAAYPATLAWYETIEARPSFHQAITSYVP
ncbi:MULTISPECIES: glutathione S-transferase family protein [unclassified Iodidimonas]|jgi:glutathione S-transferase|uniref:glutathione S-transferase family protein n=1 Tax=unclassified Iodidimonas TaxID=2626145 RepID=UPI0024827458|nr:MULTISPECIES: glutathione S-transferase family protein [unclassified Iodidimonas]